MVKVDRAGGSAVGVVRRRDDRMVGDGRAHRRRRGDRRSADLRCGDSGRVLRSNEHALTVRTVAGTRVRGAAGHVRRAEAPEASHVGRHSRAREDGRRRRIGSRSRDQSARVAGQRRARTRPTDTSAPAPPLIWLGVQMKKLTLPVTFPPPAELAVTTALSKSCVPEAVSPSGPLRCCPTES